MQNPGLLDQFFMLAINLDKPGLSGYYVGLPTEAFLPLFVGFDRIDESEIPDVVDSLIISSHPAFEKRFKFRHAA